MCEKYLTVPDFTENILGFEIQESKDTTNVYLIKDGMLFALYHLLGDLHELNAELRKWKWIYNQIRPHRALDNLTPKSILMLET